MISLPPLLGLGPFLILAMAALALIMVNLGLSRKPHTLLWVAGFGVDALRWLLLIAGALTPLTRDLLALSVVLLLTDGFRVRWYGREGWWRVPAFAVLSITGLVLAAIVGSERVGAVLLSAFALLLFTWSASCVVRPGTVPSRMEAVSIAVLTAVAAIHAGGILLLLYPAAMEGLAATELFVAAAEPMVAAVMLATLMLIASDYARELRRLLHTDPLTGVLNRAGFVHGATALLDRGRNRRLSVAIADIDHFKQVNDVHGHPVGDAALAGFARYLADALGRDAVVARIGGEEFAILFPGLEAEAALKQVEALREGMGAIVIETLPSLRFTASFGVAERAPRETLDALMERADAALYRSKREGRDRTSLAAGAPA